MKNIVVFLILIVAAATGWYLFVYEKPGPVEQLGRDVDKTIEKTKYGDETTMERARRKTRESTEELKKKIE